LGLFLRTISITANERGRNEPWKRGRKALISNKHNTAVKQYTEQYEEHVERSKSDGALQYQNWKLSDVKNLPETGKGGWLACHVA